MLLPPGIEIAQMSAGHCDQVIALWRATENVGLSEADSRCGIEAYLLRNPGMSFVACEAGRVVGAALCGTDGRRGYLHHLAVAEPHRRRGIGRELVRRCLAALRDRGIAKCNLFVFARNREAIAFWKQIGWTERVELKVVSRTTDA